MIRAFPMPFRHGWNGSSTWFRICLFFKSGRGVACAKTEITALDGIVTQEGDRELAGRLPVAALEEAQRLIRVSKRDRETRILPDIERSLRARIAATCPACTGGLGKLF